ncbi:family 47 glycosyl hydrolase [Truncatella angustata]|uniref:alpha-1,2-Mannosidase n=1 Tax=Truncatella angustata TaxID=152316 RepID=A0A9P8USS1_9PEZI|nr:family 47 glycosyl hydrolase [Truncatella angustata]KAH6657360.1 family 47 glycosyl hydrolase [Truncatella angustata]
MLAEHGEWLLQNNHMTMAALVRRPTRLLSVAAGILVFYVLIIFIPKQPDRVWNFEYVQSSYDWSALPQRHPVPSVTPLPTGTLPTLPKVQYDFASDEQPTKDRLAVLSDRRAAVRDAFVKSWDSYKKYAWMYDELEPVSGYPKDTFGGWAATLIDSLDTLWIMGLKDDFYDAAAAAVTIDWATKETSINFFETTIRHLGGLLAAYDLSKERALLNKAIEVGDMLYSAFDTPNRMPPFWLDFKRAKDGTLQPGTHDPAASTTSSGLEFTRLAQLTGDNKYYDAIDRVSRFLEQSQNTTRLPGMWPTFLDLEFMDVSTGSDFTLGALADSLYEYLPKMYAILGGLEPMYEQLYRGAMDTVTKNLLFRPMLPDQDDILFTGDITVDPSTNAVELQGEGQHLSCFVGGMYGLGGKLFNIPEHVTIGEKIAKGCAWVYDSFPTGVMPEIYNLFPCPSLEPCAWDEDAWTADGDSSLKRGFKNARDPRYLLRPEAIESIFLMYRMTGKEEYQEMAWRMFQSIKKSTETDLAFSAISDVTVSGATQKLDSMESFWTAETLKYFWLIFSSPDLISLDEYVLNTEAHPLLRPK